MIGDTIVYSTDGLYVSYNLMNGRQILISPSPLPSPSPSPSTSWQDQNAEVQLVQYNPIKIRSERPNLRLEFEQSKDNYLFVNTQFSSLHSSCQFSINHRRIPKTGRKVDSNTPRKIIHSQARPHSFVGVSRAWI